ncbi:MAG: MmgE/PrpD [Modestobacter sp.]|nr:MmgE/PrpD [Modestobacter sp.]
MAAADLARHGLTGPPTVLEGRFGFLQAFCGDRAHPDAVVRGPGTDWELPRVVFKSYPCNHFTHAIELGVAKPVLRTIAEPPEAKARPASGYHAAFSGPYTVGER